MTKLLEGQIIAKHIKEDLKYKIDTLRLQGQRIPCLAVILVGDDKASETYVASKQKQCHEVGILSVSEFLDKDTSEAELIALIEKFNQDETIDGILLQLPLPKHLNEDLILRHIDPSKDVDGLHPLNAGLLFDGKPQFIPCTPKGIMAIFSWYKIDLSGKNVLVIGRSRLVGKPLAMLLMQADATVSIAHSKTKDLKKLCQAADILCVAMGREKFITESYTHPEQIIIDVGIHRTEAGLCGDVDPLVYDKVKAITPVPRGVGPMTIASLLLNTYESYQRKEASL